MKTQHTQGEWMISDNPHLFGNSFGNDHGTAIISWVNDSRLLVATCDYSNYRLAFSLKGEEIPEYLSKKAEEANAKLIAAAPDLLEALIGIMEKCSITPSKIYEGKERPIFTAQQAIKKATE